MPISSLIKKGASVCAFDPAGMEESKKVLNEVNYAQNMYDVAKDADAIMLITEWNEFKNLNMLKIKELMKSPVLMDGRNIY